MVSVRAQSIARKGFGYGARAIATMGYIVPDVVVVAGASVGGAADNGRRDRDHYRPFNPYLYRDDDRVAQDVGLDVANTGAAEYDSRVGRRAPTIGASESIASVAPHLKSRDNLGIQVAPEPQITQSKASRVSPRLRHDDEMALVAMLALMLDHE